MEIYIHIHCQHHECEWLSFLEEGLEERLESHLLMPWVETIGVGESVMNEEKAPKAHKVYQTDYMVVEEILSMDQKVDLEGIINTSVEP